jgi:lipoate-protein ligase A
MAADYELLLAAQQGEAWVRIYGWSPACLSLGRNEPALSRYDRDLISRLGLDTVRRPTGGRAVWHEAEVTYAVAAPSETFGSMTETYVAIHQVLRQAMARLGVPAYLASRPAGGHSAIGAGACFASPAGGEVMVSGRKLIGSAQVREGGAFLQHGSVLLADGQDNVTRVTRGHAAPSSATSLSSILGRAVAFEEVALAIADAIGAQWNDVRMGSRGPPEESVSARFRDPAWTWRR